MAKKLKLPESGLFTEQDHQMLRHHRKQLTDWIVLCDKAGACGIDTGELRKIRDETDSQLANVEQHFMGGITGQM